MPEQWRGKIRYGDLILDDEVTAWMVYEGMGQWQGVMRASRELPEDVAAFSFHCADGRDLKVEVQQREIDGGKSVLKISASQGEFAADTP